MRAAPLLLVLSCSLLGAAGCSSFKEQSADAGHDATLPDTIPPADKLADSAADAAPDLTPQVPFDFVCEGGWTASSTAAGDCQLRQVFLVEGEAMPPHNLSLAVTPAGKIGILYDYLLWADEGELHLALLSGGSAPAVERIEQVPLGDFASATTSDISSGTGETFHLVYGFSSDFVQELHYRSLENGQFSNAETVIPTFPQTGSAAIAAGPAGQVMVAYHNPSTARFESRLRHLSGEWQTPQEIDRNANLGDMTMAQLDLKASPDQGFHVAYLYYGDLANAPRYSSFAGQQWLNHSNLENNFETDVLLGWSPSLALHNERRAVLYYQLNASSAELHLASWNSSLDLPAVSLLNKQDRPLASPRSYWVASDYDRHGLLHLAQLFEYSGEAFLYYNRQYTSGGEKIWLSDLIAYGLGSSASSRLVDIVIDEQDRPHIVYFDQNTAQIYYATRLDRP